MFGITQWNDFTLHGILGNFIGVNGSMLGLNSVLMGAKILTIASYLASQALFLTIYGVYAALVEKESWNYSFSYLRDTRNQWGQLGTDFIQGVTWVHRGIGNRFVGGMSSVLRLGTIGLSAINPAAGLVANRIGGQVMENVQRDDNRLEDNPLLNPEVMEGRNAEEMLRAERARQRRLFANQRAEIQRRTDAYADRGRPVARALTNRANRQPIVTEPRRVTPGSYPMIEELPHRGTQPSPEEEEDEEEEDVPYNPDYR
jgi:hypothetical protein